VALLMALASAPAFGSTHHTTAASSHSAHKAHKGKAKAGRQRGQLTIDPARATEIQLALIREHYLTGEASGKWDDATKAAMVKYQADQGWQTKLTPDSRALKKLGLGPDYSHAINAKPSSAPAPAASSAIPPVQAAGFAEAAGVSR
jgi:hypothetical protein